MKQIILGIIFIIMCQLSFSQKVVGKKEDLEKFFNTKTYIVLENNFLSTYNSAIQNAVKKAWYLTDYEFINQTQFQQKMNDPNSSFLLKTKVIDQDNITAPSYAFLTLVIGKPNTKFSDLPEVCSLPIAYYDTDFEEYDYKMPTILLFMQHHIELTRDHPELNEKNILQYYNKNINKIGQKTLYFTKDDLADEVNTKQKIQKYYKGNVEIVSQDEIEKLVDNKDENAIILHIVRPPEDYTKKGYCYKLLLDTENGQLYYFDYHKISDKKPAKFLKSDFKKLNNENK